MKSKLLLLVFLSVFLFGQNSTDLSGSDLQDLQGFKGKDLQTQDLPSPQAPQNSQPQDLQKTAQQDQETEQLKEVILAKRAYLNQDNIWARLYKIKKNLTIKEIQKEVFEKELKLININQNLNEYFVLKNKLELLEAEIKSSQKAYENIKESITIEQLNNTQLSFFHFLFASFDKKLKNYENRFAKLSKDYDDLVLYFDKLLEKFSKLKFKKAALFTQEVSADKQNFELMGWILKDNLENLTAYKTILNNKKTIYQTEELPKIIMSVFFIFVVLVVFFYGKKLIDKSVKDEDKNFSYNSILNVLIIIASFVFFAVLFFEKIIYAATILGFIGAGLIIASKELVLNYPAWVFLQFSGFLRLGDRVRFVDQGESVIGDIVSISPLKITMYESINHTTLNDQKRAGRVIFFPPHYIFTKSIFNYTHESMKTLFDLIEINLSPKSNFEKAQEIAINTTKKHTGKYTDLALKQYKGLQKKYHMRNLSAKPQINFLYKDGYICMSVWYVAPYRDILNVRSSVTRELVGAFLKEQDIEVV